jgi:hypothetical protein
MEKKGLFIKHDQRPVCKTLFFEIDSLQEQKIEELAKKYGCKYKSRVTQIKFLLDVFLKTIEKNP